MKFIRAFKELRKTDIPIAGGKGANLGELINIGMPVPPGFVITTPAYEEIAKKSRLEKSITKELKKNKNGDTIRKMILQTPVPGEIEKVIKNAFAKLGANEVAVRSSATVEDLAGAAFAGQQDSYLNIKQNELIDAIKKVWASLWSKRAIAYRDRLGIDQTTVKIAVVVQKMINAEIAGVLFTANVITGARDEMVINASPGLGEAVVSGKVIPDHFVLKKSFFGWQFTEQKQGKPKSNINKRALGKLANLGKTIQNHFGAPHDIEWAWANKKMFIVQSRPITALIAEPPKAGKLNKMFASIVAEVMPRRPYPLETLLLDFLINNFLQRAFKFAGFKITNPKKLLPQESGVVANFTGRLKIRPTIFIFLVPARLLYYILRYNPSKWKNDPLIKRATERIKKLEAKKFSRLSPKELVAIIPDSLQMFKTMITIRLRYLPRIALAILGIRIWLIFKGKSNVLATLLFTGVNTIVTKTNAKLEKLAKEINLKHNFQSEFQNFLKEFGYRESAGTMLIAEPSWKDKPEAVLEILKTMTNSPSKNAKTNWQKMRDEISQNRFFKKLLNTARLAHQIREDTRFYIMMPIRIIRLAVLEFGNRLKNKKVINAAEDIFYLKFEELEKIAKNFIISDKKSKKIKTLIISRKQKYKNLSTMPFVDPRIYKKETNEAGVIVSGTAGSPGVVEGPARLILNSSEFKKLRPGDILVAPYTNPSWTPLFEKAAGVVVDTGSVVSHAAIVAREYGIPAVMGAVEGTTKLKDNMIIRVDGTKGMVFKTN